STTSATAASCPTCCASCSPPEPRPSAARPAIGRLARRAAESITLRLEASCPTRAPVRTHIAHRSRRYWPARVPTPAPGGEHRLRGVPAGEARLVRRPRPAADLALRRRRLRVRVARRSSLVRAAR